MTNPLTFRQIITAIAETGGIFLDERCADHLKSVRGPLLTAIGMEDGEAVASTVTRAFQGVLASAGFKGQLTPHSLRKAIAEPSVGIVAFHDAIDGRENAMGHLSRWLDGANRTGLPHPSLTPRPTPAPAPPQNQAAAAPQRSGPRPDDRDHDENPLPDVARRAAPQQASQAQQQESQQQAPRQHQRGNEAVSASRAPSRQEDTNVRSIGINRQANSSYAPTESRADDRRGDQGSQAQNGATATAAWDQKNVYGGKASVQFSAGMTKGSERKEPRPTVFMECARMLDAEKRLYDWKNKIVLQLTAHELQIITALLFGLVPSCKFANHGHQGEADKWFEIEHQSEKYAGTVKIAIGKAKDVMICSMGAEDIGDVTAMFLRQCAQQMRISQAAVPATLRVVAKAYNDRKQAKSGGGEAPRRYANA